MPDTPLTPAEQVFVTEYMKGGTGADAARKAGLDPAMANQVLRRPNVQAEIQRVMEELKKNSVAAAEEVMAYFTSVMRGEVKDQFGLDAPLSERTKAAQELAKRTVDIDNKKAGIPDQNVSICLDWDR